MMTFFFYLLEISISNFKLMGLTIIYWIPIVFLGSVYLFRLTNEIVKRKLR